MDHLPLEMEAFSQSFFYGVMEKLQQAGAPKKEYQIPTITFKCNRTFSDDIEYQYLIHKIGLTEFFLSEKVAPDEIRNEVTKEVGFDCYARLAELGEKVIPEACGHYDYVTDQITLVPRAHYPSLYSTVAHELLHAARYKTVPNPDKESQSFPEHKEFFAKMEKIIRTALYPDRPQYHANGRDFDLHLRSLQEAHTRLNSGSLIQQAGGLFDLVEQLVDEIKKTSTERNTVPELEKINSYQELGEKCNRLFAPQNAPYYFLVHNLNGVYGKHPPLLPLKLPIITSIKSLKSAQKLLKFFYSHPTEDDTLHDRVFEGVIEEMIPRDRARAREAFSEKIEIENNFSYRYCLSALVLNTYQNEIQKEWPQVFLMDSEGIEKKFFLPVRQELEKMRKEI